MDLWFLVYLDFVTGTKNLCFQAKIVMWFLCRTVKTGARKD